MPTATTLHTIIRQKDLFYAFYFKIICQRRENSDNLSDNLS